MGGLPQRGPKNENAINENILVYIHSEGSQEQFYELFQFHHLPPGVLWQPSCFYSRHLYFRHMFKIVCPYTDQCFLGEFPLHILLVRYQMYAMEGRKGSTYLLLAVKQLEFVCHTFCMRGVMYINKNQSLAPLPLTPYFVESIHIK